MSRTIIITEKCPKCGMPLGVRFARANNEPFIGCTSYPACRFTEPYIERTQRAAMRINELEERLAMYERRFGRVEAEPTLTPPPPPPVASRSLIDQSIRDLFPFEPQRAPIPPVKAPAAPLPREIDFTRIKRPPRKNWVPGDVEAPMILPEPPSEAARRIAEGFLEAAREIAESFDEAPAADEDKTDIERRDYRELDLD